MAWWTPLAGAALGAAGGYFGSRGQPQQQTTQNVGSYIPSDAEAPMYGWMAEMAQNMMQTPTPYYPGQTYVSPSQPTQMGVNAMMEAAGYMPEHLRQASGNMGFLSSAADVANNQYVQDQIAANEASVTQQLMENWIPEINQGAQATGMMGSSRQGLLQAEATERAANQLARANASTMMDAYGQGLQAQQYALGQTGNFLGSMMMPGQAMMGAGQAVEGYQQAALMDQINRYNHMFQEPWQRAQNVANMAGAMRGLGTQYGAAAQPNPYYQDPMQAAIGGGMMGADVFGPLITQMMGGFGGGGY